MLYFSLVNRQPGLTRQLRQTCTRSTPDSESTWRGAWPPSGRSWPKTLRYTEQTPSESCRWDTLAAVPPAASEMVLGSVPPTLTALVHSLPHSQPWFTASHTHRLGSRPPTLTALVHSLPHSQPWFATSHTHSLSHS